MLRGWIEKDGRILSAAEAEKLTADEVSVCGGEFVLETKTLTARDCYGIMPSDNPAGIVSFKDGTKNIKPNV
ncbi:MAG TPA: asparagine synthase, partial [Methanocorpusculum sp.]|nr:asparagine synthase [Methanocorpusculum sp.]